MSTPNVSNEYKQLPCVQRMTNDYKDSFFRLVDVYGTKLNAGILNRGNPGNGNLFTLHDFDHHCFNIFQILSDVLLNKDTAFEGKGITEKELFILNISILFHDISIATNKDWIRGVHSQQSADYLRQQYKNASSAIYKEEKLLKVNDIEAIARIIEAHSDLKNVGIPDENNGIRNPVLDEDVHTGLPINVKLLAGLLRLSDELDITTARLGNKEFEDQLSASIDANGESESHNHWKMLHYFSGIAKDKDDYTKINLVADDNYIRKMIEDGDITNIIEDIESIFKKKNNEFNTINKLIFNVQQYQPIIVLSQLSIKSTIDEIKQHFEKLDNRSNMILSTSKTYPVTEERIEMEEILENSDDSTPKIIDFSLSISIADFINNNGLYKTGHFLLNSKYCARDWINTIELIETGSIADELVKSITSSIVKEVPTLSDYLILGLDIQGSLLASKIALNLQLPFSYVIPVISTKETSSHDMIIDLNPCKNIIIITDVISTWETIIEVVEEQNIKEKVALIYTILYRKPNISVDSSKLHKCTFSLNNDFETEVISKSSCRIQKENCFALNKKRR